MSMPKSNREALPGARGICLGLSNAPQGPYIKRHSVPEIHLITLVTRLSCIPPGWTSIQVNVIDAIQGAKKHRDRNNDANFDSWIMAFGDYLDSEGKGGEFLLGDDLQEYNISNSALQFKGHRYHAARGYTPGPGKIRYSLVIFRHDAINSIPDDSELKAELRSLGIPFEGECQPCPGVEHRLHPDVPTVGKSISGKVFRVAYIFCGVERRTSLKLELELLCEHEGVVLEMFEADLLKPDVQDMLDDEMYSDLLGKVKAALFHFVALSPPCSQHSRALFSGSPGP